MKLWPSLLLYIQIGNCQILKPFFFFSFSSYGLCFLDRAPDISFDSIPVTGSLLIETLFNSAYSYPIFSLANPENHGLYLLNSAFIL
uniref:Uncharacterized protein n=1 Tax=Rhizophora mucronata TaxID=61149 RepID=A0A2P2Q9P9_RHIMU